MPDSVMAFPPPVVTVKLEGTIAGGPGATSSTIVPVLMLPMEIVYVRVYLASAGAIDFDLSILEGSGVNAQTVYQNIGITEEVTIDQLISALQLGKFVVEIDANGNPSISVEPDEPMTGMTVAIDNTGSAGAVNYEIQIGYRPMNRTFDLVPVAIAGLTNAIATNAVGS